MLAAIRAVIFDMDGVLVDSEPMNFQAMRRLLAGYGLEYTEEDDRRFRGRRNLDLFATLRAAHRTLPPEGELDGQFTALLVGLLRQGCRPLPGVPDVLYQLAARGYRLALASSATPPVIAETLRSLGLDRLLIIAVSGIEVPQGKPAPDIFLEAARRIGVPPPCCLVVEDSRHGMLAALAAGMACAAVPCAATREEAFTEATVRLDALPALLTLLPDAPSTSANTAR